MTENTTHRAAHSRPASHDEVELDLAHSRRLRHELRSTVAGVSAASQMLLQRDPPMPDQHYARLQSLVEEELGQLERLLERTVPSAPVDVNLDDLIAPLVDWQRTMGVVVDWELSRTVVRTRPSEVGEAIRLVLAQVVDETPGRAVCVTVTPAPAAVQIRVRDLAARYAAWLPATAATPPAPAPASSGRGVGLYVAHRLLSDAGGTLLVERPVSGDATSVVVQLPRPRSGKGIS
ncbi:ATP-binding protein [Nocardioides sp.]|uniref:ATP-binding protein n=1 Tax=Nocardioides sp. TaxID=35761 RepID=UPI0027366022|nr:ATP-binding protein [Nocardioides sp.]MDP3892413.1 ATP-binding protein [Nocardioides sp.]